MSKVVIQDLVERIAKATADRHPEKWHDPNDPDPIRRTIVAAMSAHGWPTDGIPGVLPFVCKEVKEGRIEAFSAFNDLPCSDVSLILANPAQWYVTEESESQLLQAIAAAVERTQGRVRERSEQYERQRTEKEAAGRYTLEEAAKAISEATGEREAQLLAKLIEAARLGRLTVYHPGQMQTHRYGAGHASVVRDFYEEAYWNDLNAWLEANEPRLTFRFPDPHPDTVSVKDESGSTPESAPTKASMTDADILRTIRELGLNRYALPRNEPGEGGVRSRVLKKLDIPKADNKSFYRRWERMIKGLSLAFATDAPTSPK